MIDLAEEHLEEVRCILRAHVAGAEIRVFGSRTDGTAGPHSDLDLAIVTGSPIELRTVGRLREAFEDAKLPIRVDVLDWNRLTPEFKAVIARHYEILEI